MTNPRARFLLATLLLCTCGALSAQELASTGRTGRFIANAGQWRSEARYSYQARGLAAAFDSGGIRLLLNARGASEESPGAMVSLVFRGCDQASRIEGRAPLPGYFNYFLGNDPDRWRSRVPSFGELRYVDLYDGVDMVVRRDEAGRLAYDLHLEAGVDLGQVEIDCFGVESLELASDGALVMNTAAGPITQSAPRTWQEAVDGTRHPVTCQFELLGPERFGFRVEGRLDAELPLLIDPTLDWATFLGGDDSDEPLGLTTAADGSPILVGRARDGTVDDFPTTPGAFQVAMSGAVDAFVTRFNPSASQLEYSTFFGGTSIEMADDVEVHALTQEVVICGYTTSLDMPTTPGAFATTHSSPTTFGVASLEVFVARFTADGTGLVYSTYLGGSSQDWPRALALTASGSAVIAGTTKSGDFPISQTAADSSLGAYGLDDGFVTRLSPDGSTLVYSTFIGGTWDDEVWDVVLDSSGAAYVCGGTWLNQPLPDDFPVTPGSFDSVRDSPTALGIGFVSKISPLGDVIEASTYLESVGGLDTSVILRGIEIDASGRVVVAGRVIGPGLPTTSGAYSEVAFESIDIVLARFDSDLADLDYCTYLGSPAGTGGVEMAWELELLSDGTPVVSGRVSSANFPVTPDALQATHGGVIGAFSNDSFLFVLDLDAAPANALVYSTYLGGPSIPDDIAGLQVDSQDRVLVLMETKSQIYLPTTPGAFDEVGNPPARDAYLLRLQFQDVEFRRGDTNSDGAMDIADAVALLGVLFVSGSLPCQDAADSNDDGAVDVADAVFILSALFTLGSPVPPPPGESTCGPDPTSDTLPCLSHVSCP